MARDRVQPLKMEQPGSGGTELDEFPSALNPNEDHVDARGVTLQNATSNDEAVGLERVNSQLVLRDSDVGAHPLADLLGGAAGEPGPFGSQVAIRRGTKSPFWTLLGQAIFAGTTTVGTPSAVSVISWSTFGGVSYDVRLYDRTNNIVIASATGLFNAFPTIVSLGAGAGWSSGQAILEVHARRAGLPASRYAIVEVLRVQL